MYIAIIEVGNQRITCVHHIILADLNLMFINCYKLYIYIYMNQNLILFMRGKAISREPIIKGTSQLPNALKGTKIFPISQK